MALLGGHYDTDDEEITSGDWFPLLERADMAGLSVSLAGDSNEVSFWIEGSPDALLALVGTYLEGPIQVGLTPEEEASLTPDLAQSWDPVPIAELQNTGTPLHDVIWCRGMGDEDDGLFRIGPPFASYREALGACGNGQFPLPGDGIRYVGQPGYAAGTFPTTAELKTGIATWAPVAVQEVASRGLFVVPSTLQAVSHPKSWSRCDRRKTKDGRIARTFGCAWSAVRGLYCDTLTDERGCTYAFSFRR